MVSAVFREGVVRFTRAISSDANFTSTRKGTAPAIECEDHLARIVVMNLHGSIANISSRSTISEIEGVRAPEARV